MTISHTNVWEVAQWRHGRRMTRIPAIKLASGELSFDHGEMSDALGHTFSPVNGNQSPTPSLETPPPSTQTLPPSSQRGGRSDAEEDGEQNLAWGFRIRWQMLKWAWPAIDDTLTHLFEACLQLGYHPPLWKEAIVVVIPKPDRPDYSLPKAHRPISLLECISKLLEKVVAQRIQHNITSHDLIPSTQFGGRQHSSCLDTGLSLIHDIQDAHRSLPGPQMWNPSV
jgi:hypothetical protein